jgi:hypothetical protein
LQKNATFFCTEGSLIGRLKNRKETAQLLCMKRLIYLKNGQSLNLLVSPLKLIMSLMVSKQRKKKEYKDEIAITFNAFTD